MNALSSAEARTGASPLAGLLTISGIPSKYPDIFPGIESVRWYLREHRAGLEEAEALSMIRNRLYINADRFEQYVVRAGQQAAKRRAAAGAA